MHRKGCYYESEYQDEQNDELLIEKGSDFVDATT